MQSLQIRLPEELLGKVDALVGKGLFRSRSDVLRIALDKYISELNCIGVLPYIVGPFTPEEIELLKKPPKKNLELPEEAVEQIKKDLAKIRI